MRRRSAHVLQKSDPVLADWGDGWPRQNFSIFLKPGGRYSLTPFYDVLSAQPAFDKGQIAQNKFRLAMSVGKNRHYRIAEVMGRHFVQSGKSVGLGGDAMRHAIMQLLDRAEQAPVQALGQMPDDFAHAIHESVAAAMGKDCRISRARLMNFDRKMPVKRTVRYISICAKWRR
jgi:hypothetical protein